jgi:hypothetical protein
MNLAPLIYLDKLRSDQQRLSPGAYTEFLDRRHAGWLAERAEFLRENNVALTKNDRARHAIPIDARGAKRWEKARKTGHHADLLETFFAVGPWLSRACNHYLRSHPVGWCQQLHDGERGLSPLQKMEPPDGVKKGDGIEE